MYIHGITDRSRVEKGRVVYPHHILLTSPCLFPLIHLQNQLLTSGLQRDASPGETVYLGHVTSFLIPGISTNRLILLLNQLRVPLRVDMLCTFFFEPTIELPSLVMSWPIGFLMKGASCTGDPQDLDPLLSSGMVNI